MRLLLLAIAAVLSCSDCLRGASASSLDPASSLLSEFDESGDAPWLPLSAITVPREELSSDEFLHEFSLMSLTGTAPPAVTPTIVGNSATLSPDLTSLLLQFDSATNQPEGGCSVIFTADSLTALFNAASTVAVAGDVCPASWIASCAWLSSTLLSVGWIGRNKPASFDCGVPRHWSLSPAPVLVLQSGVIFDAALLALPMTTGLVATVSFATAMNNPANTALLQPVAAISGPTRLGSCEGLRLVNGAAISGNAARPFVTLEWSLVAPPLTLASGFSAEGITALTAALTAASNPASNSLENPSTLSLPSALLPPGGRYTFSLRVVNWMGYASVVSMTVEKSTQALPSVKILGGATWNVSRYSEIAIVPSYAASACGSSGGSASALSLSWAVQSTDTSASAWFRAGQASIVIPTGSLRPSTSYVFTLTVSDSSNPNAVVSNSASVTYHISPIPAPKLVGGQFDNSIIAIAVEFSADTNKAAMNSTVTSCAHVLAPPLLGAVGTGAQCIWSDAKSFFIVLGSGATVDASTPLSLVWSSLTSADGFSPSMTAPVSPLYPFPPATPLNPVPLIRGATSLGRDESILLSGSTSTGHGGRAFRSWEWAVIPPANASSSPASNESYAAINTLLATQRGADINIPNAMLTPGASYLIQLTLTNFLGVASLARKSVAVSGEALPQVAVLEEPPVLPLPSSIVSAKVGLALPPSWPVEEPAVISCGWHVLPPHDDSILPPELRQFKFIYQPAATAPARAANTRPTGPARGLRSFLPDAAVLDDANPAQFARSLAADVPVASNHFIWAHSAHSLSSAFSARFGNRATLSGRQSRGNSHAHRRSGREMRAMAVSGSSGSASVLSTAAYFTLPPYLLVPGDSYEFVLSVTLVPLNATPAEIAQAELISFNTASLSIVVAHSPLVASITGGDRLVTLKQGTAVSIDASHCYDPDSVAMTGRLFAVGAVPSYRWSCTKVVSGLPCFPASASAALQADAMELSLSPKLFTDALGLDPQGTAQGFLFSVTVTLLDGTSRAATATSLMSVTTQEVPSVTILRLFLVPRPNTADGIKFHAVVTPSEATYALSWSLVAPSGSTAPPTPLVASDSATGLNSFDLALNGGVLQPGVKYTLQLLAADIAAPNNIGRGRLTFTTNAPPSGGSCSVSPEFGGHSIDDSFSFVCESWNDVSDDQPLSYAFQLVKTDAAGQDASVFLAAFSAVPNLNVDVMPAGAPETNYTQVVRVLIADKLGAVTTQTLSFQALPSALLSGNSSDAATGLILTLTDMVLAPAASSGNIGAFAPAFLTAASLVPNRNAPDFYTGVGSNSSADAAVTLQRNTLMEQVSLLPNTLNNLATISQRLQLGNLVCNDAFSMDAISRALCTEYVVNQVRLARATQFYAPGARADASAGGSGESSAANAAPIHAVAFTPALTQTIFNTLDAVMTSVAHEMDEVEATTVTVTTGTRRLLQVDDATSEFATNSNLTAAAAALLEAQSLTSSFLSVVHSVSQGSVLNKLPTEAPSVVQTANLFLSSQLHAIQNLPGATLRSTSEVEGSTEASVIFPTSLYSSGSLSDSVSAAVDGAIMGGQLDAGSVLVASTLFTYSHDIYAWLGSDAPGVTGIVSVSLFNPSTNASNIPKAVNVSASVESIVGTIAVLPYNTLTVQNLRAPIRISLSHDPILQPAGFNESYSFDNETGVTTHLERRPLCRFFDDVARDWSSEGCFVDEAHSSPSLTACLCTHLTDFQLSYEDVSVSDFVPLKRLQFATQRDVLNITPENIVGHPIPLFCLCVVLAAYLLLLPLVHRWDVAQMVLWLEGKESHRKHEDIAHLHLCERWMILLKATFVYRHVWLGVLFRRPGETFTAAQKLTTCVCLLVGCMAISAFFRADSSTAAEEEHLSSAQLFYSDWLIGVYSSLLMLPVKVLVIELFRRSGKSWAVMFAEYHSIKAMILAAQKQKALHGSEAERDKSLSSRGSSKDGSNATHKAASASALATKRKELLVSSIASSATPATIQRKLAKSSKQDEFVPQVGDLVSDSRRHSKKHSKGGVDDVIDEERSVSSGSQRLKAPRINPHATSLAINVSATPPLPTRSSFAEPDSNHAHAVVLGIAATPTHESRMLDGSVDLSSDLHFVDEFSANQPNDSPATQSPGSGIRRRGKQAHIVGDGNSMSVVNEDEEERRRSTGAHEFSASRNSRGEYKTRVIWNPEAQDGAAECEEADGALTPAAVVSSDEEQAEKPKRRVLWNPAVLSPVADVPSPVAVHDLAPVKTKRTLWLPSMAAADVAASAVADVSSSPEPEVTSAAVAALAPSPAQRKKRQLWSPEWNESAASPVAASPLATTAAVRGDFLDSEEAAAHSIDPVVLAASQKKKRTIFNPEWQTQQQQQSLQDDAEDEEKRQSGPAKSTLAVPGHKSDLSQVDALCLPSQSHRRGSSACRARGGSRSNALVADESYIDVCGSEKTPTPVPGTSVVPDFPDVSALVAAAPEDLEALEALEAAAIASSSSSHDVGPSASAPRHLDPSDPNLTAEELLEALSQAPRVAAPERKKMAVGLWGDYDPEVENDKRQPKPVALEGASTAADDVDRLDQSQRRLPHACLYLTYALCLCWCIAAGFVVLLYGLKFDLLDSERSAQGRSGWSTSSKWLANVLQAVAQDLLILEPLLIALYTFGSLWLGAKTMRFCCCCRATGDKGAD